MKFQAKDRTGMRYGKLIVVSPTKRNKSGRQMWLCRCDCGNNKEVVGIALGRNVFSCGCLQKELAAKRLTKHSLSKHPLYQIWIGMKQRCSDPQSVCRKWYLDRGIIVSPEWESSFKTFYDDVIDLYILGYSIERINVNGNYEKGNVKFIPEPEQAWNKTNNRIVTFEGVSKCVGEWAHVLNIPKATIYARLNLGFTDSESLFGRPHGNIGKSRSNKKPNKCS